MTQRTVDEASQQRVGRPVRPVVAVSDIQLQSLCRNPVLAFNKAFMTADGNDPFTDILLADRLGKLRVKKR